MKISKEDLIEIIRRLSENETYNSIGKSYNVSRERIRQIARKNGLQGKGMTNRRLQKLEEESERLTNKYGEFYKEGVIAKNDFLWACKRKFTVKKNLTSKDKWNIEFGDIKWNTHCPILGLELDYFAENRQENSPSFDRINPNIWYVTGNVQIISWRANRIKNNATADELIQIGNYLKSLGN
jgi:hypothetical protein